MGECMGLDFGTTYTVVSHLLDGNGKDAVIEPIDFGGEESSVTSMESLVVVRDGTVRIGLEAVPVIRRPKSEVYKGFKLLLNCDNKELLEKRGYSDDNSPEKITSLFMEELFKKVKRAAPDCGEIDKVVVGVPYVWTQNGEDGRKFEVVDIVKKTTGAAVVEFQSEPTLACAYFVQEINKKREKPFSGHILVIDYGGGTLDVTLCQAETNGKKSNVKVCDSWGAGENTEGEIGNAGLAFMEKVADLLLIEGGISEFEKKDREYQAFVKNIEIAIKSQSSHLKECVLKDERYFSPDGKKYNDEVDGIYASYKGEEYFVKYGTLIEAYNESIRPVLARVLSEAKKDMDMLHIPYDDYLNGTFKIATIGGFCNFALTEKQIRNDTEWLRSHHDTMDTRYTELDDAVRPKNRELAIAYGAALNANDIVGIKRQFPYTLCIYPEKPKKDATGQRVKENGKDVIIPDEEREYVVFRENDEYVPGKPVFLTYEEDGIVKRFCGQGGELPYIRRRKGAKKSEIKRPSEEMKLSSKESDDIYIALAMERNEKITLYEYKQAVFDTLSPEEQENPRNRALVGQPSEFPNIDKLLGSFYKMS